MSSYSQKEMNMGEHSCRYINCPRPGRPHRHDERGHIIEQCSAGVDGCNRADFHIHSTGIEGNPVDKPRIEHVNHPGHYGGDTTYETIKVLAAWGLGFCLGNAVKYISRAGKKDPSKLVEDLKKARWYLDEAVKRLERGEPLF